MNIVFSVDTALSVFVTYFYMYVHLFRLEVEHLFNVFNRKTNLLEKKDSIFFYGKKLTLKVMGNLY